VVHHLYPAVPFYRYAGIWRLQGDELIAKGVQVRSLSGRVLEAPAAL
jgi:fatty acid desaturase